MKERRTHRLEVSVLPFPELVECCRTVRSVCPKDQLVITGYLGFEMTFIDLLNIFIYWKQHALKQVSQRICTIRIPVV